MPISLAETIPALARSAADIIERQIVDGGGEHVGAYRRTDWGLPDPTGSYSLAVVCTLTVLARRLAPQFASEAPEDESLLARAALAARYLLKAQHPSGLIDLLDCNFDSAPDAGFATQAMCPIFELARMLPAIDDGLAGVLTDMETFTRRLAQGMVGAGFHTPNHRWVMSAGMAWAKSLFADLDVDAEIDRYLAEGIDCDAEGLYIERSAGVYDAICDKSLLVLDKIRGCPEGAEAAVRNLELNLHMLHADGTVETGLSRRQDYGTRSVPGSLALPYLLASERTPNPRFVAAAQSLWDAGHGDAAGLTWFLLTRRLTEVPAATAPAPSRYSVFYPGAGVWRVRRDRLSATVFRGTTRLMTLVSGQAELSSVKISQSYFGVGRFVGETLTVDGHSGVLRCPGTGAVHRPGYDHPTGAPVPVEGWYEFRAERPWRPLPPCDSELEAREAEDGFDLVYRTLDGWSGVPAQIALDFPAGGEWETDDTVIKPQAGQVLFLKRGTGSMRYGHDVIEIGPGADGHRMAAMRDSEAAPGHVRVLMTFLTPVRHQWRVRTFRRP